MRSRQVIAFAALAGMGLGLAGASAAAAAEPLTCADFLTPATAQQFEAAGLQGLNTEPEAGTPDDGPERYNCYWSDGRGGEIQLTYRRASGEYQQGLEESYRARGFAQLPASEGTLWSDGFGAAYFRGGYLADGFMALVDPPASFTVTMPELAQQLAGIIVGERSPTAEPVTTPPPAGASRPADPGALAADEPSTLRALPTAAELGLTPVRAVATAGLALVLAALVGIPARLLESAVGSNYSRIASWADPVLRRTRKLSQRIGNALRRVPPPASIGLGLIVAAIIGGFIDPGFGFSAGSLRLFLSILSGFVVEGLLGILLLRWVLARSGARTIVQFRAGSLLVVLAAVIVTRLTGFQPGLVFGVLLALTAVTALSAVMERRSAFAEVGWLLGLGLVSWGTYSVVAPLAEGVIPLFFAESLAGLTVGFLAALPLVMLPVRGLPGQVLNRSLGVIRWTLLYAVGLFAFLVILLPFPASWERVDIPFVTWVALYAAYALLAVVVWALLTLPRRRAAGGERTPVGKG